MVLGERWQVIMPATIYSYQSDLMRINFLQCFAVPDRDQPVPGAMQNIRMAFYFPYPLICSQMVFQQPFIRQYRQESLHHPDKIIVRRIQNQVTRGIIRSDLSCKAAAHTAAIHQHMILLVLTGQRLVHKLHIAEQVFLVPAARTFSKTTIIYQHHIILVPLKIFCIFTPAF